MLNGSQDRTLLTDAFHQGAMLRIAAFVLDQRPGQGAHTWDFDRRGGTNDGSVCLRSRTPGTYQVPHRGGAPRKALRLDLAPELQGILTAFVPASSEVIAIDI